MFPLASLTLCLVCAVEVLCLSAGQKQNVVRFRGTPRADDVAGMLGADSGRSKWRASFENGLMAQKEGIYEAILKTAAVGSRGPDGPGPCHRPAGFWSPCWSEHSEPAIPCWSTHPASGGHLSGERFLRPLLWHLSQCSQPQGRAGLLCVPWHA